MGHNILFGERLCKFQDESLATFVIFEYKELLVLNYLYKCCITLPFYGLSNNKLKSLNSFFSMAPSYLLFSVINSASFNRNWAVPDATRLHVTKSVNSLALLNDTDVNSF